MAKRAILPALMITLLLAACGGGQAAEEKLEARRDALAAAEEITFTAEVTAYPGGEVFQCTLACTATPEEVTAEVRAPETLAGVRASVREGETTLRYDGVQLSLGGAGTEHMGPLAVVPLLCGALRTGHVVRAWTERDGETEEALVAAEIYAGDDYQLTVWFAETGPDPVHAVVSAEGVELVRCDIREFTYR